jgi:hypothetical protein
MGARRTCGAWAIVGATLAGCCNYTSDVTVQYSRTGRSAAFQIGGTTTLYARVLETSAPICPVRDRYNSVSAPERISFRSLDSSVAAVTRAGKFTARAVGETRIFAIAAGDTSYGAYVTVVASQATGARSAPPTAAHTVVAHAAHAAPDSAPQWELRDANVGRATRQGCLQSMVHRLVSADTFTRIVSC